MQISRKALVAIYTSIPAPVMAMYVALCVYTALANLAALHGDISDFSASLKYAAYTSAYVGIVVFATTAFALFSVVEAIIRPNAPKV